MFPGSQNDVTPSSRWSFSSLRTALLPSPLSSAALAVKSASEPGKPLGSPDSSKAIGSGGFLEWPSTPPLSSAPLPQNASFTSTGLLSNDDDNVKATTTQQQQRSHLHFMTRTATADDVRLPPAADISAIPQVQDTPTIQPLQNRSFSAPSIVDLLKYVVPYELAEFGSPHHHRSGRGSSNKS